MVRVISQETFNDVVKENIQEFSMSPEEAIESAVQELEAQGVDLSNVVKELMENTPADSSKKSLLHTISRLKGLLKTDTKLPELCQELSELKAECDKDLAHKILAGKNGAYDLLIKVLELYETNRDVTLVTLDAMISLMTGQPDLLDEKGTNLIIKFLKEHIDLGTQRQVLQWTKQCCLKHENNRQNIFDHDIVNILKQFLENGASSALLIRDVCSVIKALVVDDDIRVEFGKAHEHARSFANEILTIIVDLLKKYPDDKETLSSLFSTLSSLVVTNDFCQLVEEAGGLIFINDVMVNFPDSEKINQQCLWLLKNLAGNDEVKMKIIRNGTAPLIIGAMERHRKSPYVILAGNACIAALSLRSPANSRALCDAGAAEAVVYGMKAHLDRVDLQVKGCWAIRNIVARERSLAPLFLEMGVEEHLNSIIKKHDKRCDYDVKAALRDLGCEVKLIEQWTGKGGALN
ncbi:armadillo repeat-containing protein 6 homolog [Schistocerca cancellata]|uniref:armadillo repeat-containing protein 6 homolog n=1 Tax=Schistocerca cancellata TaxID=274614 RepID=UPI002119253F|nr:armadillo repeat-containing protein 6 homolog [Schistocerca cancellata]